MRVAVVTILTHGLQFSHRVEIAEEAQEYEVADIAYMLYVNFINAMKEKLSSTEFHELVRETDYTYHIIREE